MENREKRFVTLEDGRVIFISGPGGGGGSAGAGYEKVEEHRSSGAFEESNVQGGGEQQWLSTEMDNTLVSVSLTGEDKNAYLVNETTYKPGEGIDYSGVLDSHYGHVMFTEGSKLEAYLKKRYGIDWDSSSLPLQRARGRDASAPMRRLQVQQSRTGQLGWGQWKSKEAKMKIPEGIKAFDPQEHSAGVRLYKLRAVSEQECEVVPTVVDYEDAAKRPWKYVVKQDDELCYCEKCGDNYDKKDDGTCGPCPKCAPETKGVLESLKEGFENLLHNIFGQKAYQVQGFHSDFGTADGAWSFSGADGNALIDKGGWPLFKKVHLVCTEDGTPENKGAYKYPVAKLVGGKPTYFFRAASTVNAGLSGGARSADLPSDVNGRVAATVKKIYKAFDRDPGAVTTGEKRFVTVKKEMLDNKTEKGNNKDSMLQGLKQYQTAGFAFKANDGSMWWLQFTTNAFKDREREIFSTEALKSFVARHSDKKDKGEFWYRHIPGSKFGTVRWQAMVGRFLAQAGPFDDTPVGRYFKGFFEKYPLSHPDIAPNGWGTSHGYYYKASDRKDGVYNWFEIRESTVLSRDIASNPWSPMPMLIRRKDMNEQERKELETIGGLDLVKLVEQQGIGATKELEELGVDFKKAEAEVKQDEEEEEEEGLPPELAEAMEEEEEEEEEEEKQAEPEPQESPLTRDEVAQAMGVITKTLRSEIEAAVKDAVTELRNELSPMLGEVKDYLENKAEQEEEEKRLTPAASLIDRLNSIIGQERAAVKEGDPLLGNKPAETPMQQVAQQGVVFPPGFMQMFAEGSDQKR
jgi:hypothetical protein